MSDIFELVKTEENAYQTVPHAVTDNWDWKMSEHINLTVLYKNSVFSNGKQDQKPFKNIIRPILTLQYTAEDFDVKDIELYVNDPKAYYKSFLVRKYHDKWAVDNHIDTFIDEMVESYVDFGAALVKNVNSARPEVVKLQTIAFCDQSNLLAGNFAIKHSYAPDQLREVGDELGWGKLEKGATKTIDEVIRTARDDKTTPQNPNRTTKTSGKNIDVYEIHGVFPKTWLNKGNDDDYMSEDADVAYSRQLHIITFPKGKEEDGVCLFKGPEKELPFKLILRDEIFNRALGLGGAEELFEPQVWTNWNEITMKEMLEHASKVIYQGADTTFTTHNNVKNADNGEYWVHEDGKPVSQVNTQPINFALFEKKVNDWEIHAKQMGFANDALMGVSPSSGTPFALQDLIVQTGRGPHERRKGKLATFLSEIYTDWVIPHIADEITKGTEFLSELSLEEVQTIADQVTECEFNKYTIEKILNGEIVDTQMLEQMKADYKVQFMKKGTKWFLKTLKDEITEDLGVKVNIAGKQADLAGMAQKLSNIFRQIFANPQGFIQVMQIPQAAKAFNELLEASGMSQMNFGSYQPTPSPMQQNQLQTNQPTQ